MGTDFPEGTDSEFDREVRRREANRPLEEAGEGESEGFELAEADLIDHASHGDMHGTGPIIRDARTDEDATRAPDDDTFGEADQEERPDLGQDQGDERD
jgi:hypothetical protein